MTAEMCECGIMHPELIEELKPKLPDEKQAIDLAEFFKVFGDSTRIRILWALDRSELCVCDLAAVMGMSKSAVSHQLRVLRNADLVRTRREGKAVYYKISDEHVKEIFEKAVEHLEED